MIFGWHKSAGSLKETFDMKDNRETNTLIY